MKGHPSRRVEIKRDSRARIGGIRSKGDDKSTPAAGKEPTYSLSPRRRRRRCRPSKAKARGRIERDESSGSSID